MANKAQKKEQKQGMRSAPLPIPPREGEGTLQIQPHHLSKTFEGLSYLLLALAVFLAYSNVYDGAFLFDDGLLITRNELLKSWASFDRLLTASTTEGVGVRGGFYRPLQNILYFLIYQLAGLSVWAFHLLNVSLHAVNACLVYTLGRRLGFNPWAVFSAALLWALHPLHTEVIAYISGTADPLYVTFCLLGLITLLPDLTQQKIRRAIPFFILALLSKEGAVVFPVLAMSCLFLLEKDRWNPKLYKQIWILWLIAGIYFVWRLTAPGLDTPETYSHLYEQNNFENLRLYAGHFSYRLYTFLATLPLYGELLVWPVGLHMERNFPIYVSLKPVEVWIGIGIVSAAIGQIIRKRKQYSPLSWGIIWFAAAYFPNTGLIFPLNAQFYEHWLYLPSIGLFLGTAESLFLSLNRLKYAWARPAVFAFTVLAAGALGIRTFDQNKTWHDPFTFYNHILQQGEVSARAHNNLALAYMEQKDYQKAIEEFRKSLAITSTLPETWHNLGIAYMNLPDARAHTADAIVNLRHALALDRDFWRAHQAMADLYEREGNADKVAYHRRRVREILNKKK